LIFFYFIHETAIAFRFTHMVRPGTHIIVKAAENPDNGTIQFVVTNKDGHRAISDGCVTFLSASG